MILVKLCFCFCFQVASEKRFLSSNRINNEHKIKSLWQRYHVVGRIKSCGLPFCFSLTIIQNSNSEWADARISAEKFSMEVGGNRKTNAGK